MSFGFYRLLSQIQMSLSYLAIIVVPGINYINYKKLYPIRIQKLYLFWNISSQDSSPSNFHKSPSKLYLCKSHFAELYAKYWAPRKINRVVVCPFIKICLNNSVSELQNEIQIFLREPSLY